VCSGRVVGGGHVRSVSNDVGRGSGCLIVVVGLGKCWSNEGCRCGGNVRRVRRGRRAAIARRGGCGKVSVGLGEGRRFARSGDSSVYGVDVDVVCGVCGSGDVVCVGCGGAAGGVIGGEPVLNHDRRWG